MRRYDFPARREDINACNDIQQLKEWERQFEATLMQMEDDFGGIGNAPEKAWKYAHANQMNLRQIKYKIRRLTSPVTSAGALKCFHDTAREMLPNEYGYIVEKTKERLGKAGEDWDELIKYRKSHKIQE